MQAAIWGIMGVTTREGYYEHIGLSVEPLEYVLVRSHFTEEDLVGMRRLRKAGPVDQLIMAELEQIVQVVMHELGFPRPEDRVSDAPEAAARRWLGDICEDEDLLVDNQMMVPAHYDANTGRYKVWCFLGSRRCMPLARVPSSCLLLP
eukprot:m51a1_g8586 hypothetical protein (148) ;mRNA; f:51199-53438